MKWAQQVLALKIIIFNITLWLICPISKWETYVIWITLTESFVFILMTRSSLSWSTFILWYFCMVRFNFKWEINSINRRSRSEKLKNIFNENILGLDNIWPALQWNHPISNYGDLSVFWLISVDVLLLITTS